MSDATPPARGVPLAVLQTQTPTAPHPSAPNIDAIRHAAQQFESMFLNEMLEPMFEGLDTDGLGGGGIGEEMFRPMLVQQYAQAIAHSGGIGLTDNLVRELTRMQTTPVAPAAAAPAADDAPKAEDEDHAVHR